jgi:hypothetical protein
LETSVDHVPKVTTGLPEALHPRHLFVILVGSALEIAIIDAAFGVTVRVIVLWGSDRADSQ